MRGLTGCVIAAPLFQYHSALDVILLESGTDASLHPLTKDTGGVLSLLGSDSNDCYETVPQHNTENSIHNITTGKVFDMRSILNYA